MNVGDLRSFSKTMTLIGRNVSTNADALVRKVALAVDSTVVLATPVDTGQARSNWQVSLDQPEQNTIPPYDPGSQGSSAQNNANAAINQGKQVIASYKGGVDICIANNLDYIDDLNNGKSLQAPAGFVEEAVLAGVAMIQSSGPIAVIQAGQNINP